MKKLILTFLIIILVLVIHKETDNFISMSQSERNSYIASQRRRRTSESWSQVFGSRNNCT